MVEVHPSTKTGERLVNAMGGKFASRVYEKSQYKKRSNPPFRKLFLRKIKLKMRYFKGRNNIIFD